MCAGCSSHSLPSPSAWPILFVAESSCPHSLDSHNAPSADRVTASPHAAQPLQCMCVAESSSDPASEGSLRVESRSSVAMIRSSGESPSIVPRPDHPLTVNLRLDLVLAVRSAFSTDASDMVPVPDVPRVVGVRV